MASLTLTTNGNKHHHRTLDKARVVGITFPTNTTFIGKCKHYEHMHLQESTRATERNNKFVTVVDLQIF